MGSLERVWWVVVECACRILGISTAVVLCAVGVETLGQGEFHSLAVYLLVSAAGMMLFEMAYFLDALLIMCLPCPPDWCLFVLWEKMAHLGGFQKFLYYSIMSVVCFLHPVLVWHAVIPGTMTLTGTMLLVTAFFNFILSKKAKTAPPKGPQDSYSESGLSSVCVAERGPSSEPTFSLLHMVTGRKGTSLASVPRGRSLGVGERGESTQAMLEVELEQRGGSTERVREDKRGKEKRHVFFREREVSGEREMQEMEGFCESEPETTSDTAPMISG
ncbi:transmembrane protein 72 isoform X1 [Hypomesus transpacificus]|uniref:transmembrane protein 72 isoform X1 n=1 Tax=Hypomesus transpacificus TaxID=137520 RepID=UPI001F0804D0|nr:transmembrane protein 72 isoform X1 [Hypomesus transpacificus]